MKVLLIFAGLFVGAWLDGGTGFVYGGVIGFLFGTLLNYRDRLLALETKLEQLYTVTSTRSTPVEQVSPVEQAKETPVSDWQPHQPDKIKTAASATPSSTATVPPVSSGDGRRAPSNTSASLLLDRIAAGIKAFFTTGNVVVKVGMIILFFGVAFLLKYAIDRNQFPIELRLTGIAVFSIIMLIIGWRLRMKKPGFALVIQGGAVGMLYLTIFTAAKLYTVLPLGLAFAVMAALVVFSSCLAVVQNSLALAIFATAGGFLAPVLVSTNTGNHVALFSYYALLNAGILLIAWNKAWRSLNWVGFMFTFVIGTFWGITRYQPEHFNTTEPFLILFFIFYLTISILYAVRQPRQLKGFVDATLVFGTPLVGFTLQSALVRDFEFGLALSALVLALIYIGLAKLLWKKQIEYLRMLTESFLAIGVIFASLAIPFALDGRWTAAAWALEGAGMIWVGIRQQRLSARLFGMLLHIGGGLAFLQGSGSPRGEIPILNSTYIGSVLIGLAGLYSAWLYHRYKDRLTQPEKELHIILLIWGLCWWFGAGLTEIVVQLTDRFEENVALIFIAASMWSLTWISRRMVWSTAGFPPVLLLPAMVFIAFIQFADGRDISPLANLGIIAWTSGFAIQYLILYKSESLWKRSLLANWHAGTLWLGLFIVSWSLAQALTHYVAGMLTWGEYAWGLVPAMAVYMLLNMRNNLAWPFNAFESSYVSAGLFPVIIYLMLWVLLLCTYVGDPSPLPYVPIVNPQDIIQLFALLAIVNWVKQLQHREIPPVTALQPAQLWIILCAISFIWLNALVAHAVHFYGGVRYVAGDMIGSALFQTSISIVWTVVAFVLMYSATRRSWRNIWLTGAGLLGAVVVKLFMVDLADSGTVARIVSFMTVGSLMLLIGYYSPLPPKVPQQDPVA